MMCKKTMVLGVVAAAILTMRWATRTEIRAAEKDDTPYAGQPRDGLYVPSESEGDGWTPQAADTDKPGEQYQDVMTSLGRDRRAGAKAATAPSRVTPHLEAPATRADAQELAKTWPINRWLAAARAQWYLVAVPAVLAGFVAVWLVVRVRRRPSKTAPPLLVFGPVGSIASQGQQSDPTRKKVPPRRAA